MLHHQTYYFSHIIKTKLGAKGRGCCGVMNVTHCTFTTARTILICLVSGCRHLKSDWPSVNAQQTRVSHLVKSAGKCRRCISHGIRVKNARNCTRQQTLASFAHSVLPGSTVCLCLCPKNNRNLTLAATAKHASCC
jgi:uncharacterized protein YaiE (UPF0345 family)